MVLQGVTSTRASLRASAAMFVILAALVCLGIYQLQPLHARPVSSGATAFSTERALADLQVIARQPHPVGSPENALVRDYIVSQLQQLGLTVEVQTATSSRTIRGTTRTAEVQNIIARLPGTQPGRSVALAAHYDSVEGGAGASDDGVAVAMMLETARVLRAGPPLRNDVLFIFTDGEERGLLGAKVFVDQHPVAQTIGAVLNFEARGTTGPSYLFETGNGNGWLISEFAQAVPAPIGFSFTDAIYRVLPNNTDFTEFRRGGINGLNFAFIDGFVNYHTPRDDLAHVETRSLEHHASYGLSLAQRLGNQDLTTTDANNVIYFSLLGSFMLYYPESWAILLTALLGIVFVGVLVLGLRRKRLTLRGMALGAGAFLLVLGVTVGAIFLIVFLLPFIHNGRLMLPQGATYNSHIYAISFVVLALALISAFYAWFSRRIRWHDLTIGAWLWWLIFLVLTTIYLPGLSYVFLWPLLFGLIALAGLFLLPEEWRGLSPYLLLLLPAVVGILMVTPLIYGLFIALGINLYPVVGVFVTLLLGLLLPHIHLMSQSLRKWLPIGSAIIALGLILFAALTAGV